MVFLPVVARDGQKQIGLFLKVEFLEEIDASLPRLGYSDRSTFIREAVFRELEREGVKIAAHLKEAPSRVGKGGRPPLVVKSAPKETPPSKPADLPPLRVADLSKKKRSNGKKG